MALSRTHLCQRLVKSFTPTLQSSRYPAFTVTSGFHTSTSNQNKGQIFDKKPAKVELEAGKKYSWCACGHSKKQPFCDGSHKKEEGGFKSVRFEIEESKTRSKYNRPTKSLSFRREDTPLPDKEIFERHIIRKKEGIERAKFPNDFALEPTKGKIYDKKPFKIWLDAGKKYKWCSCGRSKTQPLCDDTHIRLDGTNFIKTAPRFRPFQFTVPESREYFLCNCKQSNNRPFCDGTHRRQDIQDAIRS